MSSRARDAWIVVGLALASAIVARAVARVALEDVPHVMDEIAYVFQARTFARGYLNAPLVLPREAFALWFVDDRTSRFSIFPPGWPAVLALGVRVGLLRWVNPLLHAATVPIVAVAGRKLGGRRVGIVAAVLYATSPQAIVLAASLMSHTLVALAAATALAVGIALATGRTRGRPAAAAAIGGAAVGVALSARPLCGVVVALGLGALLVVRFVRGVRGVRGVHGMRGVRGEQSGRAWPRPLRSMVVVAASGAAPVLLALALLGAYNRALTGDAARFPQTVWFDEHLPPDADPFFDYHPGCNALGLGPGHGCDHSLRAGYHDLQNALSNTGDNLTSWSALAGGGPLAFVAALAAIAGAWRRRRRRRGRRGGHAARGGELAVHLGVLLVPLAAIGLYALYWYAGTCYGARFYHAGLPALLVLAAVGLSRAAVPRGARVAIASVWAAASAIAFVAAFGELSHAYWGTDARFARLAASWRGERRALVMVAFAEDEIPMHRLRVTGTTSSVKNVWHDSVRALGATGRNEPWIDRTAVAFAKYHPQLVDDLRARFPDRALYMYVAHEDPSRDTLSPFEGSQLAGIDRIGARPRPNFGAYVVPAYARR